MKKWYLILVAVFMTILTIDNVHAEDLWYYPTVGSNYFKSQHTYSWHMPGIDEQLIGWIPIISDLRKNSPDEDLDYQTFTNKYKLPWTIDEQNYVVVYCADKYTNYVNGAAYRRVPIMQSTYIADNVKTNIIGILRNSYPYISKEEMIENLVDAGVFVKKELDGETIYTAKNNESPTMTVTEDELVSATQMAIANIVSPGLIDNIYYGTAALKDKSLTTIHGIHEYAYGDGKYSTVDNNIHAIYDYLIKQHDDDAIFNIKEITTNNDNNSYTLRVLTNRKINDKDDLKVALYTNNQKVAEYNLKDLKTDNNGAYIFKINDINSLNKDSIITLSGTEYSYDGVYVYEAVEGKDYAQTQVGISTDYRTVYSETVVAGAFKENPNIKVPNTLDNIFKYILILVGGGAVLLLASILKLKNKKS